MSTAESEEKDFFKHELINLAVALVFKSVTDEE